MPAFDRPCAISERTSRSRADSVASGIACRCIATSSATTTGSRGRARDTVHRVQEVRNESMNPVFERCDPVAVLQQGSSACCTSMCAERHHDGYSGKPLAGSALPHRAPRLVGGASDIHKNPIGPQLADMKSSRGAALPAFRPARPGPIKQAGPSSRISKYHRR